MHVRSLGQEARLEKEMTTHTSILAWRIPWIEVPGRLQFLWLQSQPQLSMHTHTFIHRIWNSKGWSCPSFLPESQRSLLKLLLQPLRNQFTDAGALAQDFKWGPLHNSSCIFIHSAYFSLLTSGLLALGLAPFLVIASRLYCLKCCPHFLSL